MRRLLYSLTFASVLLLASLTSLASFDVPGGSGTVPAYQVWLPVVEKVVPCVFDMKITSPVEGTVFHWGDPIPVSFSWRRMDAGTETNVVVFCVAIPGEGCKYILGYWGGNTPGARHGESSFDLRKWPYFQAGVDGKYAIQGEASCERIPDGHTEIIRNFYIISQSK